MSKMKINHFDEGVHICGLIEKKRVVVAVIVNKSFNEGYFHSFVTHFELILWCWGCERKFGSQNA
ncbi:hypothetical protein BpHYR1_000465 [Brachionus plicatilis]|uniref:Uncharacterized protein n=1 Tax=Brachionus plicatilis TaxID=10195 RepID=A0A3M7RMK6_BRAPC|nr:hypothetical protein BpHYR1_000465 [Brachionus plicatilis]